MMLTFLLSFSTDVTTNHMFKRFENGGCHYQAIWDHERRNKRKRKRNPTMTKKRIPGPKARTKIRRTRRSVCAGCGKFGTRGPEQARDTWLSLIRGGKRSGSRPSPVFVVDGADFLGFVAQKLVTPFRGCSGGRRHGWAPNRVSGGNFP